MHKKFVERLAKIYVTKLVNKGNAEAKGWAERLLKPQDTLAVAVEVREILRKRGFKVDA